MQPAPVQATATATATRAQRRIIDPPDRIAGARPGSVSCGRRGDARRAAMCHRPRRMSESRHPESPVPTAAYDRPVPDAPRSTPASGSALPLIGVVGAGVMGSGIAQLALEAGHEVVV